MITGGGARSKVGRRHGVISLLLSLTAVGLVLACVLAWLSVWPLVLLEHFRVHFVAVGVVTFAVAGVLRRPWPMDLAAQASVVHLLYLVKFLAATPAAGPRDAIPVRVLVLNVHTSSTSYHAVRSLISDHAPDVVAFVEVDRRWLDELSSALAGYPGRIADPRDDNFGIALYARGTISGSVERLDSEVPSIIAEVGVSGSRFHVVVTHPLPPVKAALQDMLDRQLAAVAARARSLPEPVLVMGDLNTTPWSRAFRHLLDLSGLCDTRAGFGIGATFPAWLGSLGIPIDHVLASCSVGVSDRRVGPDVGSDHLPVVVDLELPGGPAR